MDSGEPESMVSSPARVRFNLIAIVAGALAVGGICGYAIGARDDRTTSSSASTVSGSAADTTVTSDVGDTATSDAIVPLGAQATLGSYLDALVAHDWRVAHDLMCVDLAEDISAGSLKTELADSEENAGPLTGYDVVRQTPDETRAALTVEYILEFERGTVEITAALEREGTQWRLCSFENHGGTGVFDDTGSGTG
jgi:hypothetical protein